MCVPLAIVCPCARCVDAITSAGSSAAHTPDGDGFLADRDVQEAGKLARAEPLLDLLLEPADQEHLAQQLAQTCLPRAPFPRARVLQPGSSRPHYADCPHAARRPVEPPRTGSARRVARGKPRGPDRVTRRAAPRGRRARAGSTGPERRQACPHGPPRRRAGRPGRACDVSSAASTRCGSGASSSCPASRPRPRPSAKPRLRQRRRRRHRRSWLPGTRRPPGCRTTGATPLLRSRSTRATYSPRAALLCAPINPTRDPRRTGFVFRVARRAGYGVSPGMAHRCLERCDAEGITGRIRILHVLAETDNVATQGPSGTSADGCCSSAAPGTCPFQPDLHGRSTEGTRRSSPTLASSPDAGRSGRRASPSSA